MPKIACRNCGAEIPPASTSCPACGAPRQRVGSPATWEPAATRRAALLAGIILALVILAALLWSIADSRRTPLQPTAPVLMLDRGAAPGHG